MSLGMVPKTDVNYTNKLENKWYSWRQTSTILYLLIRKIPAQEHYAVRDYWINSIKIDQMPRRKIYLFLRPAPHPLVWLLSMLFSGFEWAQS